MTLRISLKTPIRVSLCSLLCLLHATLSASGQPGGLDEKPYYNASKPVAIPGARPVRSQSEATPMGDTSQSAPADSHLHRSGHSSDESGNESGGSVSNSRRSSGGSSRSSSKRSSRGSSPRDGHRSLSSSPPREEKFGRGSSCLIELYQGNEYQGIVIILRNKGPIGYALPAGRNKERETSKQTVIREVQEEVGITGLRDLRVLEEKDNYHADSRFTKLIETVYAARAYNQEPSQDNQLEVQYAFCLNLNTDNVEEELENLALNGITNPITGQHYPGTPFVFDHDQIIIEYVHKRDREQRREQARIAEMQRLQEEARRAQEEAHQRALEAQRKEELDERVRKQALLEARRRSGRPRVGVRRSLASSMGALELNSGSDIFDFNP